ncbi:MAG: DUF3343 domain-containing protein [Deltaproteobacteria bacterium]|jgi:hypothetical protein|nr:DUF3343 domain-containing protein [Deltaproteobacteria bacterium]
MEQAEIILVFSSNTKILNAEDLLEEKNLPFVLVPVPKEVNPNCGLAISFLEAHQDRILPVLAAADLRPEAAYRRLGQEFGAWPLASEKTGPYSSERQPENQL